MVPLMLRLSVTWLLLSTVNCTCRTKYLLLNEALLNTCPHIVPAKTGIIILKMTGILRHRWNFRTVPPRQHCRALAPVDIAPDGPRVRLYSTILLAMVLM